MCVQPDPALSPFTEPPKRSLVFTRVFVRHIAHILYNGRELIADDEVVRLWVQSESPPETLDAAHQVVDFVKRSVRLQVGDKMQIRLQDTRGVCCSPSTIARAIVLFPLPVLDFMSRQPSVHEEMVP